MSQSTEPMRSTAPSITVNGDPLGTQVLEDLLELRVVRGMRTTGRATMTFVDRTFSLAAAAFKIGGTVEIASIEPEADLFTGTITAVAMDIDKDGARATVTVHDKSLAMARTRTVATFTKQTATDIVETLARESGLKTEVPASSGSRMDEWTWRTDSLLGQLDEVCERLGWEWIVDGNTLRIVAVAALKVPAATCKLEQGENLLRFAAEQSKPVTTEVMVRGWDTATKTAISSTKKTPREESGFAAEGRDSAPNATTVATRHAVTSQAEANDLAGALAAAAATVTARGRAFFSPRVEPGKAVTIKGTGPGDGDYYVREVEHTYDGRLLRTSFVAGFRPPTLVSDPWNAHRSSGSKLASGTHTGEVTNVNDPDKLGRVKVTLTSVSEHIELGWARVIALGGGPKRGIQWLPEPNDEVLVAFEDGDTRRPVVIGGLYNAKDAPPVGEFGTRVETRTMASRLGHKIEFGDGEGEKTQYVDIVLADGKVRLHLGADRIDLETADKPLRIASGGGEILFDGKGGITIKGDSITLEAKQDVKLNGMNVKTTAKSAAEIEGATTTVKAKASLKLQATGIAELAGSMVKIN